MDHYPWNVPDFQTDPQAKTYPFAYSADEIPDLAPSSAQAANSVCPSPLWGRGRTASSAVVHHSQSKERILRAISDRRAGNILVALALPQLSRRSARGWSAAQVLDRIRSATTGANSINKSST